MTKTLAICGGEPVCNKKDPCWPIYDEKEVELITNVIRSGKWSFDGPYELEFARKFAEFHNAAYGECVANGTVALEVALEANDILHEDEVIVPALTWPATATAALSIGAVPIFADIDPETYCISPKSICDVLTSRTKAVVPVHLYSTVCDMDEITDISSKHGLKVIEDCAHVVGSQWRGRGIGSLGNASCFSFQQTKPMTSGEGGIVLTQNEETAERIYSYKNCGRTRKSREKVLGNNYRITEFQAAILLAQLERFPEQLAIRERNIDYLTQKMREIDGVKPLKRDSRVTRQGTYSLVMRYDSCSFEGVPIDLFRKALEKEGIPTFDVYPPVYRNPLWHLDPRKHSYAIKRINSKHQYPVADLVDKEAILFGHQLFLGDRTDMDDIYFAVKKIQDNANELCDMIPSLSK